MTTMSNIQKNVMRRVRTIHAVRTWLRTRVLSLLAIGAGLVGIGHEVFVAQVIANMPSVTDVAALARFFTAALFNTEFAVQVLVALCVVAFVWFVVDGVKSLGGDRQFA